MNVADILLDLADQASNNEISLEDACTQIFQPEISSSVNFEVISSLLEQTRRHQFDLVYLGYCLSRIILEAAKIVGDKRLELECLYSYFAYSLLVGNTSSESMYTYLGKTCLALRKGEEALRVIEEGKPRVLREQLAQRAAKLGLDEVLDWRQLKSVFKMKGAVLCHFPKEQFPVNAYHVKFPL